ncbi:MAG: hypothetical protein Ct9H300mP10_02480 [Methanobacteriota archaeon]|nr:MAG: hypothetical protein Ct9H300mP10_02480 [Euryarchaeota archaeon]
MIDADGDGVEEMNCIAGPSNSSSTDDECYLWLDPANWTQGEYEVRIHSNGSLWQTISLTVVLTTTRRPCRQKASHSARTRGAEEDDSSVLLSAAVLMAGAAAFVWVVRNVKGDEAE